MSYIELILGVIILLGFLTLLIVYFFKKEDTIILKSKMDSEEGYTSLPENLRKILHAKGKSLTPMNPSGIIEIEGVRFDAQSRGEYIEPGNEVEVIGFDSVTPVVKLV